MRGIDYDKCCEAFGETGKMTENIRELYMYWFKNDWNDVTKVTDPPSEAANVITGRVCNQKVPYDVKFLVILVRIIKWVIEQAQKLFIQDLFIYLLFVINKLFTNNLCQPIAIVEFPEVVWCNLNYTNYIRIFQEILMDQFQRAHDQLEN